MKIRQLALRNWKNFTHADVTIRDRLFLVGPKASGKSNFLDMFRFLRDLASTGGGKPSRTSTGSLPAAKGPVHLRLPHAR